MSRLMRWWRAYCFQREVAHAHGFKTRIRRGEGFDQWLERETALWVKGN